MPWTVASGTPTVKRASRAVDGGIEVGGCAGCGNNLTRLAFATQPAPAIRNEHVRTVTLWDILWDEM